MFGNKISFNNFKCMLGQKKNGVQFGGDYILKHNKNPIYRSNNIQTIYINSKYDYTKGYNIINKNLKNGMFNLNLGGDHSISVCTIKPIIELFNKDLLVIWIDAHGDINTIKSSKTQNTHGMPLSYLMKIPNYWNPIHINSINKLYPSNLIYLGIRDLDDYEENIIYKKKITFYKKFNSKIIDIIDKHPAKYIHISCDIDSMDPSIMPSTGTSVPKGLSREDVESIIIACNDRLISFDLVEFNPMIGNEKDVNKTLTNINKIIEIIISRNLYKPKPIFL